MVHTTTSYRNRKETKKGIDIPFLPRRQMPRNKITWHIGNSQWEARITRVHHLGQGNDGKHIILIPSKLREHPRSNDTPTEGYPWKERMVSAHWRRVVPGMPRLRPYLFRLASLHSYNFATWWKQNRKTNLPFSRQLGHLYHEQFTSICRLKVTNPPTWLSTLTKTKKPSRKLNKEVLFRKTPNKN